MQRLLRQNTWLLAGTLGLLIIVGLVLIQVALTPGRSSTPFDIWPEVAKTGLQLCAITALGVVVTAAFRLVDARRARDQQRRQLFREILTAYNQVKATRRNLRALGMLDVGCRIFDGDQVKELKAEMRAVNEAQLRFEEIARSIEQTDLFRDSATIVELLRMAEEFLNKKVVEKWETEGGQISTGVGAVELGRLKLDVFVGHKRDGSTEFEDHVSTPLDKLTKTIHRELFG